LSELDRLARALELPLQWFLTGTVTPKDDFRDLGIELHHLGIVDLAIPDARVPGAFRRPEQVVVWALSGGSVNPRIVEAVPAVLAWNELNPGLLNEFARAHDRRAIYRAAWLADVTIVLDRQEFPGGVAAAHRLSDFLAGAQPPETADSLGFPATPSDTLPPVSRRWNITYAASLDTFRQRAAELHALRIAVPARRRKDAET
jgi:hypothetical protein